MQVDISPDSPSKKPPRLMMPLVLGLVISFVILCLVGVYPIETLAHLILGWTLYLHRTLPEVRMNPAGLATALICLGVLFLGLHLFLRAMVRPPSSATSARSWKISWTATILAGVVLTFAAGIAAVGIFHQTGWLLNSPEPLFEGGIQLATLRMYSSNNLKQIGLAVHNSTFDRQDRLPGLDPLAAGTIHSWQTQLLPYLEMEKVYKQIRQDLPWDHPENRAAFQTAMKVYLNPRINLRDVDGYAASHYAGNVRLLGRTPGMNLKQDFQKVGTSQIILAGEVAEGFRPWGDPRNLRDPARGIGISPTTFGAPVGGKMSGVQVLLLDGSVRTFAGTTDPDYREVKDNPGW